MIVTTSVAGILAIHVWSRNRTYKISYLRLFIQIIGQVAIFYIIAYPLWLGFVLCFFIFITLFFGRFFCGWICPFGFYLDLVTWLRKFSKKHHWNLSDNLNINLHRFRYVILAIILVLPLFSGPLYPLSWSSVILLIGSFNPYRILLGPLVPVIAPWRGLILFEGIHLNFPYMDQIVYYSSSNFALFNVLIFIALTLGASFWIRRFWCRFCPTGLSLAVVNRLTGFAWAPTIYINKVEEKCTKCGVCKRVCHLQVSDVYEQKGGKILTSMCMLCFRCVEMCPYKDALEVKFFQKTIFKSRNWLESQKVM